MNTVQAFKKAKFVALLLLCFSAFIYAFGRSISKLTSGETSVEMEFQRLDCLLKIITTFLNNVF